MGSSLASAISNAGAGDTITFAQDCPTATPITLTNTQTITKNLTLDGTGHTVVISGGNAVGLFVVNDGVIFGVTGLTLTGGNSASNSSGGIANNGGTVTVMNSTLSGNSAPNGFGGGIANNGGTLTVMNSTLSGNSANSGGGGIVNGDTLTVTNSTLSGNSAAGYGGGGILNSGTVTVTNSTLSGNSSGGIHNGSDPNGRNGTVTVTNSILSGNSASGGGGILNRGMLTVVNSTLSGNSATNGTGGGIHNNGGTVTIMNSTLSNNTAPYGGGGILNDSKLTVTNSTLSNNTAPINGGGIYNYGTLTVTNSTLSGNSGGGFGGGGIFNNGGTLTVTNSTLSSNVSTSFGGGIFNQSTGTATVTNSTLSGNTANSGGGGIFNQSGGTVNAANTLIVNSPSGGDLGGSGINGTNSHNLTGSFTFATPLQNNGGPTRTLAIPTLAIPTAIDAYQGGDLATCNAIASSGTPAGVYDQRGANRVVSGKCSIGAYEPGLVATTTTLSAPTSAAFGTPVTFTASVRGVRGSTPPDGTNVVTFTNGTTALGTANLTGGTATFTTSTLLVGNSVTATYSGSTNHAASPASNAVTVTITAGACVVTSTLDPTEATKLTLRDIVNAANAGVCTGNAITFDTTAFPAATAQTITLGSALTVSAAVTVDGTGHMVTVKGASGQEVFAVAAGGGQTVAFTGLTISGSTGIANGGTVTVTNSTFSGNGTGIVNVGTVTVINSTVSGNGTGIDNGGTVTVTNSTFSGNGIGITIDRGSTVTVTNSTLSGNGTGFSISGTVTVTNTIVAGNTSSDVSTGGTSTINDGGHNLTGNGSISGGTGDRSGPALLAALGNYGGPTQTFALLPDSPALGGGDPTICAAALPNAVGGVDQRGVTRPDAGTCDIGAFESRGFTVAKTSGDGQGVVFGNAPAFAPLTATVTSKDAGVVVNGGTLTFVIVPGSDSATFGAGGGTGCTVSVDGHTARGCTVNASGLATSPPFTGSTTPGGFTVTASATPGDAPEATYTETVSKATPTVGVTSSPNPSAFGQSVTFTATVTGVSGTAPTGTVQFAYTSMGGTSTPIGNPVALTAVMGATATANMLITALPVGTDTITATYTGDGTYTAGTPRTLVQTVVVPNATPAPHAAATTVMGTVGSMPTAHEPGPAAGGGTPTPMAQPARR